MATEVNEELPKVVEQGNEKKSHGSPAGSNTLH